MTRKKCLSEFGGVGGRPVVTGWPVIYVVCIPYYVCSLLSGSGAVIIGQFESKCRGLHNRISPLR